LQDIYGIGPRMEQRLHRAGIEMRRCDQAVLRSACSLASHAPYTVVRVHLAPRIRVGRRESSLRRANAAG
jgi:hypothetical protein